MDSGLVAGRLKDRGFASMQFVIASALALLFFTALINVMVVQYARGAVRSALDQGARAGSLNGSVETCEERVDEVLSDLLGGEIGETRTFRCELAGPLIRAEGSVIVDSWTIFTSEFTIDLAAEATVEING